jgi:acetyltransferase
MSVVDASAGVAAIETWRGRALWIRPIVPDDEARHSAFFAHLAPDDLRLRFFSLRRDVPHAEMLRLVHPDATREVAIMALAADADGELDEVASARAVSDADNVEAEFGITVRSDLKRQGLGRLLLSHLITRVRRRGTQRIACDVLPENAPMRALARGLGFHVDPQAPIGGPLRYVLALGAAAGP